MSAKLPHYLQLQGTRIAVLKTTNRVVESWIFSHSVHQDAPFFVTRARLFRPPSDSGTLTT